MRRFFQFAKRVPRWWFGGEGFGTLWSLCLTVINLGKKTVAEFPANIKWVNKVRVRKCYENHAKTQFKKSQCEVHAIPTHGWRWVRPHRWSRWITGGLPGWWIAHGRASFLRNRWIRRVGRLLATFIVHDRARRVRRVRSVSSRLSSRGTRWIAHRCRVVRKNLLRVRRVVLGNCWVTLW